MEKKQHYRLNVEKQRSIPQKLTFNVGFGGIQEQVEPNYYRMAEDLNRNYRNFLLDLEVRQSRRTIKDLKHIVYIEIEFQDQFEFKYENKWREKFGLSLVSLTKFNRVGLFSVNEEDYNLFEFFLSNVYNFVSIHYLGSDSLLSTDYSNYIKYIRSFKLIKTDDIVSSIKNFLEENPNSLIPLLNVNLTDIDDNDLSLKNDIVNSLLLFLHKLKTTEDKENDIIGSLVEYLDKENIEAEYHEHLNVIELKNINADILLTIVDNFDVIHSVTNSFIKVHPSTFNIKTTGYNFEVEKPIDELPIIGIIDTGISQDTPLKTVTIQDNEFTLIDNPLVDSSGDYLEGHGTAVGALAAFGKTPYLQGYTGSIEADARLLSIKIISQNENYLSTEKVINVLERVVNKYPEIKLFTLTIGYDAHKKRNEEFLSYTYELDKFAFKNNCLIFISSGNTNISNVSRYDLNFFDLDETNLCTPADSLNNITVGSAADNISSNFVGIATNPSYPSLFSRTSHINLKDFFSRNKQNRHYKKPDILASGGDYEFTSDGMFIVQGETASIQVLSAKPNEGFYKQIGTSFSAPLVANVAAKILRKYPNIETQTVKALILNSANKIDISQEDQKKLDNVIGHGVIDEDICLSSTDSNISLIIEDKIENDKILTYPIHFPSYLTEEEIGKNLGIIKLQATLCFSFLPIKNNHLSYCPINIAFGFFRNQEIEDILSPNREVESKLKQRSNWSQQGHQVSKPIPYSNTQKISFSINRNELEREDNTIMLAVRCRLSKQISIADATLYPQEYKYSIAIRMEENFKGDLKGNLYEEFALSNNIEQIISTDTSSDLDVSI